MKLEKQVCSLEQSKRLKELGISINNSLFVYIDNLALKKVEGIRVSKETQCFKIFKEIKDAIFIKFYSAFTVSELGIMLGKYWEQIRFPKDGKPITDNEAIDRANVLIMFIEENMIKVETANNRLKKA